MMLIIPHVGIHHHEQFLFCVCLGAALSICLLYIMPYPRVESQWGCAESVAQSEQRYLTLALGELPVMDFFGANFHNFFFFF